MINFLKEIMEYCKATGLEYVEGLCEVAVMPATGEGTATIIPDGAYRASVLQYGVERVFGFYPLRAHTAPTEEEKDGARLSLLRSLIAKAVNL